MTTLSKTTSLVLFVFVLFGSFKATASTFDKIKSSQQSDFLITQRPEVIFGMSKIDPEKMFFIFNTDQSKKIPEAIKYGKLKLDWFKTSDGVFGIISRNISSNEIQKIIGETQTASRFSWWMNVAYAGDKCELTSNTAPTMSMIGGKLALYSQSLFCKECGEEFLRKIRDEFVGAIEGPIKLAKALLEDPAKLIKEALASIDKLASQFAEQTKKAIQNLGFILDNLTKLPEKIRASVLCDISTSLGAMAIGSIAMPGPNGLRKLISDAPKFFLRIKQQEKLVAALTSHENSIRQLGGLLPKFNGVLPGKPIQTRGFGNQNTTVEHFTSHKNEFPTPPKNPEEYQQMAKNFASSRRLTSLTSEKFPNGTQTKFDPTTGEFLVVRGETIVTYHIKEERRLEAGLRQLVMMDR